MVEKISTGSEVMFVFGTKIFLKTDFKGEFSYSRRVV